eukprot:scaffold81618_cov46-Attheya_sp.AAC.5
MTVDLPNCCYYPRLYSFRAGRHVVPPSCRQISQLLPNKFVKLRVTVSETIYMSLKNSNLRDLNHFCKTSNIPTISDMRSSPPSSLATQQLLSLFPALFRLHGNWYLSTCVYVGKLISLVIDPSGTGSLLEVPSKLTDGHSHSFCASVDD